MKRDIQLIDMFLNNDDKIITLDGKVQMCRRKWYQLFKTGGHKHETMMGKVWIRYNW